MNDWIRRSLLAAMVGSQPLAGGQSASVRASSRIPRLDGAALATKPRYEPRDHYISRRVEGFTLIVNKPFLATQDALARQTLEILERHLHQIVRCVPAEPLKKLRSIALWVEENESHHPCMAYHPSAEWLREHDMNPEKAGCVELSNARHFVEWTKTQPSMVLHELAHGYHHQFLAGGFNNAEVKKAFASAMKARRYEGVRRNDGRTQKAYATTDPMEYFAESTEAYFGENDFFPFVRAELQAHDPGMFNLLKRLWYDGESKLPASPRTTPGPLKPGS